ncbi:putative bifunctional diguanylate cyclase/phosphodiesterase [Vibrio sinaloensis]|uniref:putative bifunctional diguanylate cyclase/phosphodiesterase n=1 Tax=Photobacterium sp. (strain ATCC 43367) TaxID=379097 RepID=UPI0035E55936
MFTLAIALILAGVLLLIFGLVTARGICAKTRHKGWQALSILITSFILGYTSVLVSLIISQTIDAVVFGLSIILFCGSIFVYMVTRFSLNTIDKLHKLAEEEKYNALHDPLTSLPNRKHCIETINCLIEGEVPFQLMLLDVVNFKQVNDGMGHFCGDQLLIQIGQRIATYIEKGDFVARIGGDEFVIICPNRDDISSQTLANQINSSLKKTFSIDGFELTTSAIIGISSFPQQGRDAEQVINAADVAMYWAKKSGQEITRFKPSMSQGARKKLQISRAIDEALERDEFRVYYQPIVCSKLDVVCGYEALMRWIKPDGTTISPIDFIPVAEQSNKITSITEWVLDKVAQDIQQFFQHGLHCPIHVNLSAKDLMGRNLENQLTRLSQQYPDFVNAVVLEITESTAINRLRSPEQLLDKLKSLGFKISLDDFGTGYSSLSLLRDLPVDQIKIDRSFLYQLENNERNRSIVLNAISLAHGLGYTVVAEGVEEPEILQILRKYGCDYIQGFYYSPAIPIEEAIQWSLNHNPPQIGELAHFT